MQGFYCWGKRKEALQNHEHHVTSKYMIWPLYWFQVWCTFWGLGVWRQDSAKCVSDSTETAVLILRHTGTCHATQSCVESRRWENLAMARENTNSPTEQKDGKTKHPWQGVSMWMSYCLQRKWNYFMTIILCSYSSYALTIKCSFLLIFYCIF